MKVIALAFCALVAATGAQAQTLKDFLDVSIKAWNTPTEPFKLMGNIYYVGTNGLASYLITTPEGLILIDTALPEATSQIKSSIAKLGFKVADIKYLINSHAHFDHTGGLAELKRDSGAQMIAGAADKPLLEGGYYPGQESTAELKFPPVKVDRAVKEGDTVTLGGMTLTAHATPGHSPGCTSWEMKVSDGGKDYNVLLFCSATVALNNLVSHPTYPGIIEDYRQTFEKAKTMHPDVFLAPHPEMYGMQEKRAKLAEGAPNPFVKQGEFNAFTDGLSKAFDVALAKQTEAAKAVKN